MGLFRSLVGAVKDIGSDLGSAVNTLIVDPTKDIIEGGLDLTANTINTGLNTAGSLLQGDISGAYGDLRGGVKNVGNIIDETYMDIRDPAVAAAVLAGNYFVPGSSMLTSQLANQGAQNILGSSGGKTLNFAAGVGGGLNGNLSGYDLASQQTGLTTGSSLADRFLANRALSSLTGNPSSGTGTMATLNNTQTQQQQDSLFAQLLPFLMQTGGGLLQGSTNQQAAQTQANALRAAGQQAASSAQFRPVGTTTTFGTSNFQVDPTTGQLTSAGYQLSPQLQAYQNSIMGGGQQSLTDAANLQNLGRGYIAQSPEAAAQQYMANQQALLAPSRDMESARLANQLQQTGRTGVSVAQGGNLGMANPEQQALANARAIQDLNLAAQAQQAGQAQTTFGQGLLTSAYDPFNAGLKTATGVEALGQQPFTLSQGLGTAASTAGANAGRLGLAANMSAADAVLRSNQVSPTADILAALGKTPTATSALGGAIGGLFGGTTNAGNLSGLGNIFSSDTLNFGGWTGGGTNVYNPDAFSLGGNYSGGGFSDVFNLGSVDTSSWF